MEKTNTLEECRTLADQLTTQRKLDREYEIENQKRLAQAKNLETEMKNKQVYDKIKAEILDGTIIKKAIADQISKRSETLPYFIIKTRTDQYYQDRAQQSGIPYPPKALHVNYDMLEDDGVMSLYSLNAIFNSTRYGEKTLLEIFAENFTHPIRMIKNHFHGDFFLKIRWNDPTIMKPANIPVKPVKEKDKCILM